MVDILVMIEVLLLFESALTVVVATIMTIVVMTITNFDFTNIFKIIMIMIIMIRTVPMDDSNDINSNDDTER